LAATAPEHEVVGVVPNADVVRYVVLHVGWVVRIADVSEPAKAPNEGVIVGIASPYVTLGLEAVIATDFCWIVTVPLVYENA
jgi:hypothetical protein